MRGARVITHAVMQPERETPLRKCELLPAIHLRVVFQFPNLGQSAGGKRSTKPHEAALFMRPAVISWIVLA